MIRPMAKGLGKRKHEGEDERETSHGRRAQSAATQKPQATISTVTPLSQNMR